MGRAKRIWYLSPMRAAKVQASLRIRAVSPEPPLLAHTSSESRGTFRQKARSLAPLNGWACAVKICNDGMLEDTNSLGGAQIIFSSLVLKCYLVSIANCTLTMLSRNISILGPVVQRIISLTKSLVNDSLSLLVRLKSSVLIFFAEKMWGVFSAKKWQCFYV